VTNYPLNHGSLLLLSPGHDSLFTLYRSRSPSHQCRSEVSFPAWPLAIIIASARKRETRATTFWLSRRMPIRLWFPQRRCHAQTQKFQRSLHDQGSWKLHQ